MPKDSKIQTLVGYEKSMLDLVGLLKDFGQMNVLIACKILLGSESILDCSNIHCKIPW